MVHLFQNNLGLNACIPIQGITVEIRKQTVDFFNKKDIFCFYGVFLFEFLYTIH